MWPRRIDDTHFFTARENGTLKSKHVILDVSLHLRTTRSICIGVHSALISTDHLIAMGVRTLTQRSTGRQVLRAPLPASTASLPAIFGDTSILFEHVGSCWRRLKTFCFHPLPTYMALFVYPRHLFLRPSASPVQSIFFSICLH